MAPTSTSQTFDRGLQVLSLIAEAEHALSIDAVAETLGLHRSIIYRLVRTLEERGLVERDDLGGLQPGIGLAVLARRVRPTLRSAAAPVLASLADSLRMTAFLVVRERDEAVTVDSIEPTTTAAHVVYRPGNRHPIGRGAPGLALLAGRAALPGERVEVGDTRTRGWATSNGEVIAGMSSIAAPISGADAAVAVVWLTAASAETERVAVAVRDAAITIASRLGRS